APAGHNPSALVGCGSRSPPSPSPPEPTRSAPAPSVPPTPPGGRRPPPPGVSAGGSAPPTTPPAGGSWSAGPPSPPPSGSPSRVVRPLRPLPPATAGVRTEAARGCRAPPPPSRRPAAGIQPWDFSRPPTQPLVERLLALLRRGSHVVGVQPFPVPVIQAECADHGLAV